MKNNQHNGILALLVLMALCGRTMAGESAATTNQTEAAQPSESDAAIAPAAFMAAGSKYISLSGGYVTTDYEDVDSSVEGWRINLAVEQSQGGKILHGAVIGYMETEAERSGVQTVKYKVKTIPIYYAPKLVVGKKALKVFAKGALGCHFSDYSRSGTLGSDSTDEFGFYGGASVGGMVVIKQKLFVNAEYEWAYMSNSYFQDGAVQSALVGVGVRF